MGYSPWGCRESDKIERLTLFSGKDHTFLFVLSTFCTEFLKELRMCICKRCPPWLAGWRSISRGHMEPTSILGQVTKETFTEQLSVRFLVSSDNSVVPPASPEDTLCSPNGGDKEAKQPAGSQCRPPASLLVCSAGSLRRPPRPPPRLHLHKESTRITSCS